MECEKLDDKLSSDSLVVVNMVEVNNPVNYIILTTLMEYVEMGWLLAWLVPMRLVML